MKTKVTINGVEYNLDLEKAKELGVLEEKDLRCKSWEEFHKKYSTEERYFHVPTTACAQLTREEAIAIYAFSKLLKLRRDWVGDWNPDWENAERKYCIVAVCNRLTITSYYSDHHTFSFPTEKIAREFFDCFKYLFEECKNLI